MATTYNNRLDMRNIITVVILALCLVGGVMLVGRIFGAGASFLTSMFHSEPVISEAPDLTLGQATTATSDNGAKVVYTVVGVSSKSAQVMTVDDDGAEAIYDCPLKSLGSLETMAKTCTDLTAGHYGEGKATRHQYNMVKLYTPTVKIEDDPECYYAQRYGVDCNDVKTIGRDYFCINHPEVMKEGECNNATGK